MLNAYFVDYLHVQKGLSVEEGTAAVTLFGLGAVIGTVTGGIIGQRIYNSPGGRSRIALVMGVTTALGSIPGYYFLNAERGTGPGDAWLYLSCLVGGILASVTPPNVRAVLLNVNLPETRGTMFAFYTQIDDVGKGAGPRSWRGSSWNLGRRNAFNIAVSGWLPVRRHPALPVPVRGQGRGECAGGCAGGVGRGGGCVQRGDGGGGGEKQ